MSRLRSLPRRRMLRSAPWRSGRGAARAGWAPVVALAGLLACGTKADDSAASQPGAGDSAAPDCGGTVQAIEPGLSVPCDSSDCGVEIVQTTPAPPDRGDNLWQLRVVDAAGAPLSAAGLAVAPFMPAHNHGTAPARFEGRRTDGVWEVGPFDLFMPGRWELSAVVRIDENTTSTAVFAFCVEG